MVGDSVQGHALSDSAYAERVREKGSCGNERLWILPFMRSLEINAMEFRCQALQGLLIMCLQCSNDIDNLPMSHPNYDRYVRDIRASCPYPYWKRLRDERRKKQLAKGHEARKSTVHLQSQCFFSLSGRVLRPGTRAHHRHLIGIRFRKRYNL